MSTLTIDFDPVIFRLLFPIYDDPVKYPDALLQQFWDQATCFVSNEVGELITEECRRQLINYMTAHLLSIWNLINDRDGTEPGDGGIDDSNTVVSSSIGDVSVTVQPPPIGSQFDWWINQTPYGKHFLALLSVSSVGGLYLGGSVERQAFRKVGGAFY